MEKTVKSFLVGFVFSAAHHDRFIAPTAASSHYSIPPVRAARTFSGISGLKASSPYLTHSTARISHLAGPILTRLISKLCNREQTANKSASYVDEHRTCEGMGTFSVPPVPLGGAGAGTLRPPRIRTTLQHEAIQRPNSLIGAGIL